MSHQMLRPCIVKVSVLGYIPLCIGESTCISIKTIIYQYIDKCNFVDVFNYDNIC